MNGVDLNFARLLWARGRNLKSLVLQATDKPVVVLCYHRVADKPLDINALAVTPNNFRAQLEYLKRNFPILRFEDEWTDHRHTAVAITFDDGYADNLQVALPIIEEVGVPVTFFISTAAIGARNEFWWDELERFTLGKFDYPAVFTLNDSRHGGIWPTATIADRRVMFRALHTLLLKATATQRSEWLQQIREWAGGRRQSNGDNRLMTEKELRLLAASPWVTIGAHTVSHPLLATLSEQEQRTEIFASKQYLEQLLGKEITVFSYPFGKKSDYDMTSVRLCREAGFLKAAAAFPGEAHRRTDPFQIPRHFVYNWDASALATYLKGRWIG